jgi:acyl-homoserine-lactone acylase
MMSLYPLLAALSLPATVVGPAGSSPMGAPALLPDSVSDARIADRVEIVRTEYGVPHVLADDLEAMAYALGWLQSEDHGAVAAINLVKARGEYALHAHPDSLEDALDDDFQARETYARAAETYDLLRPETRSVYEGFVAGVRHYVRLHPDEFPDWVQPDFTAVDAHALEVQSWSRSDARRFVRRWQARQDSATAAGAERESAEESREREAFALDGSNAWAFGPSRTESGRAILLRNPHLTWGAGYYEAHVRVPGILEFYGDFRIGSAFGIIGGFNQHLGWATTNNYPTYSQVYALQRDPDLPEHYVLDGDPYPVMTRETTVDFRTPEGGLDSETRVTRHTRYGPVIHETDEHLYILKDPRDGEFRRGEQFLRMMMAASLEEWLEVMRMRAHPSSNFTYADAAGNIAHYYNARLPLLPHEPTGDTAAVARSERQMWSELVPWEDLPLYLNPPGGYVQQANDTPDYTNLNVPMDRDTVPPNLPDPRLRLRSQLSLTLAHAEPGGGSPRSAAGPDGLLSLEEVVALKHSPRMLVAERLVTDLVRLVRERGSDARVREAGQVLARWDRTASADARGGVLFKLWEQAYRSSVDTADFFREPWTKDRPMETPSGLGEPDSALAALAVAADSMEARGWPLNIRWGEVHRVIRGEVDVPVSGCEGTLGCFRTLSFEETEDGRRAANRGDAWVFAVEFGEPPYGDPPRAYTVLAYGQSPKEDSPHHADQAEMFARGAMKAVAWTDQAIREGTTRRYRPGR